MGLLRERCAEFRKGHLRYCCTQTWMRNGGQIPRNVTAICETSKIPCEERFGVPFNGPVIPFGAKVEYHTISAKDISRLHHAGESLERRQVGGRH